MDPAKNADTAPTPSTHWEDLVHAQVLNGNVVNNTVTLTTLHSAAEMVVDVMTGEATITLKLNTNIENVNRALKAYFMPVDHWVVKE